eukprot:CAMPEP_0179366900 /NCGR_PEP_ID=MMETSP0797-20121207/83297_1 /TAXON_ID=47934 /ORGANISM="Dinophysis acuminata, Strain DAEP01" /LENGTH=254 /DNA_ID=CAMNT_0021082433 /DNA_START=4 /DNA_END=766 /DNA_ORIENTATION=+
MTQEDIEQVDVDDFFRPLTEEEAEEKRRLKREREERKHQREEAAGIRPLRDTGMSPEQVREQVGRIEADRREMTLLMDRCDRPAVKARLGEFLLEMDNDLARLREDPLELDDDDRRELRLFHLRKMRLPGAARAQREFAEETTGAPKALGPAGGDAGTPRHEEEIWQEVPTFMLDLGDAEAPTVTVDVRIEATSTSASCTGGGEEVPALQDLPAAGHRPGAVVVPRQAQPRRGRAGQAAGGVRGARARGGRGEE